MAGVKSISQVGDAMCVGHRFTLIDVEWARYNLDVCDGPFEAPNRELAFTLVNIVFVTWRDP